MERIARPWWGKNVKESFKLNKATSMAFHLLIFTLLCASAALSADNSDETQKALTMLTDFANSVCKDIPLEGKGESIELTGSAKIKLNELLEKLATTNIEGSGKFSKENYKNVKQQDLLNALKQSTDCKLEIIKLFKNDILPAKSSKRTSGHTILTDGFIAFAESGYKFSTKEIVSWDSSKADIEVAKKQGDSTPSFFMPYDSGPYENPQWDKRSNSGIKLLPQAQSLDAIKECPHQGYEYHWYKPATGKYYCVRTRDGQSYVAIYVDSISEKKIGFDYIAISN